MALHVESKHEKMVEDVKVLKIGAPKASEDVKKVDEHNDVQLSMDNFKFQRTIARGMFGEVNEYTSIKSGHSFAIKVSSESLESENITSPLLGADKVTCT